MRLFNSVYEIKLRIIMMLCLNEEQAYSTDKIVLLDFLATYGKMFQLSDTNLNGDGIYKLAEIASRRSLVSEAVKELVLQGMIVPLMNNGFVYKISKVGMVYAMRFESPYSVEYRDVMQKAINKYGNKTEQELLQMLEKSALKERKDD